VDLPELAEIEQAITGEREWCVYNQKEWVHVNDFHRVNTLPKSNCITLKLRPSHKQNKKIVYDSLSLYKHAAQSYEWRPCRVVHRQLLAKH